MQDVSLSDAHAPWALHGHQPHKCSHTESHNGQHGRDQTHCAWDVNEGYLKFGRCHIICLSHTGFLDDVKLKEQNILTDETEVMTGPKTKASTQKGTNMDHNEILRF